jgi:6-phosphogluconolactonase (cycloisomerase 2 family)
MATAMIIRAFVAIMTAGAVVFSATPAAADDVVHRVLYVTNWGSDNISAFQVADDGTLIAPPTLAPVPAGAHEPLAAMESSDGRHLYVTNWGSGGVSTFAIAPDGALSPVVTVGTGLVNSAGITVRGNRLYVANFNNRAAGTLTTFGIGTDGSPTVLTTQDSRGRGSAGVAVSPDGHQLAMANMGSGDVSLFRIDGDGMPVWSATRETAAGAFFPAFTTDGRFLLVANAEADSLSVLGVDGDAQLVTTIPSGGNGPRGLAIDSAGTVHVAHYNEGTLPGSVTSFAITPDGHLVPLGDPVSTSGNGAEAIVAHGNSLYVANFNTDGPGSVAALRLKAGNRPQVMGDPTMTGGLEPDFDSIVVHTLAPK